VTCQCICKCKKEADDDKEPLLCTTCALLDALLARDHGLPDMPTVWPKLEPLEPITDAQKDKAIENVVAENGF